MKMNFEQLDFEITKLYEMPLDESNENAIYDHCKMIENFIISNGWTEEEYNDHLFKISNPDTDVNLN